MVGLCVSEERYLRKLIEALQHPEPETRRFAAWLLGEKKAVAAVEPLKDAAEAFHRRDPLFLASVARALGKIGSPSAVPFLARLLRCGYLEVRLAAVEALGRLATEAAMSELKAALYDPNASVREAAMSVMAALSKSKAVQARREEDPDLATNR